MLQALCFLCGFVANLPTAFSISCYSCGDYPGSSQPCSSPSVNHCGDYFYDSCMSMSVTGEIFGIRYTTTIKNCSISQFQCNSSFVCDQVNSSLAASNGTLHACSVNCCYGDLCNGQGGGGNNSVYISFYNITNEFHAYGGPQLSHQNKMLTSNSNHSHQIQITHSKFKSLTAN